MTKKSPVLIGIILDVSSSMRNNWTNLDGKNVPRFNVVRDALNEQVWKLSVIPGIEGSTTEVFCLGLGFQKAVTYSKVDLQTEEIEPAEPLVIHESNLICDLLALSELIPTRDTLTMLERSLNDKWAAYAERMLAKIRQETLNNVEQQLGDFIRKGIDHSAHQYLYKSWRYLLLTRLGGIARIQRWSSLARLFQHLSVHVESWEVKIQRACSNESRKFVERIRAEAEHLFEEKKAEYAKLINTQLREFAARQIQIIFELLSAGHPPDHVLSYFDEDKAHLIASEIFGHLKRDVEEHIRAPIMKDLRKYLVGLRFQLHATLGRDDLEILAERFIQRYAWSILEPFVQNTVFSIIELSFREVAKNMVLYWISTSAKREVIQPIQDFRGILPNAVEEETLQSEYLFGLTPIKEALHLASVRFLKPKYKAYDKFLVIISDGEFESSALPQSLLAPAEVLVELLKQNGITVASLCVAKRNVVHRLVTRASPKWPEGMKTMLSLSSTLEENPMFAKWLLERNPQLALKSRLFVQINDAKLLQEVFGAILAYDVL